MEVVASPLTFNHALSLAKRRRPCSPMVEVSVDSGSSDDFIMTDDNQYHHAKKRRIGSMTDEGFTTSPLSGSLFPSAFQLSAMNYIPKQVTGTFLYSIWYTFRISFTYHDNQSLIAGFLRPQVRYLRNDHLQVKIQPLVMININLLTICVK